MKNVSPTLFLLALVTATYQKSTACEIRFNNEGAAKQIYQTGDIVVVKITLMLEHRNCTISLDETSIKT